MRLHLLTRVSLTVLILSVSGNVFAHPGGIDSYGGHNDRKNGGYHFHRGPLVGQSFASKDIALAALKTQQSVAPQGVVNENPRTGSGQAAPPAAQEYDLDALVRLLIAKGIISEAELRAAAAGVSPDPDRAVVATPSPEPPQQSGAVTGTGTSQTTASGQPIYVGPRGGRYHYSPSGKKVYERHRK